MNYDNSWNVCRNSSEIIVGATSAPSTYNHIFLEAQKFGIKTYAYLDSWVNFSGRIEKPPTEILVSDGWAHEYAKKVFPQATINFFENYFLTFVKESYNPQTKKSILYLDSPPNNYNGLNSPKHNKNCICVELLAIENRFHQKIIYRPHPGYARSKCALNIKNNSHVTFSSNPYSLVFDLNQSEFLVGPVSYVHYIAEEIGIPAFITQIQNNNWHGPKFRTLNL